MAGQGLGDIGITTAQRGTGSITQVGKSYFPDPWCDVASLEMPRSLQNVLEWAEFVWLTNGTYRMACERVVSYFITKLEVGEVDDEVAKKYTDYFTDVLRYADTLRLLGNDFQCFHGDVKTTTRDGVFRLRDLVGQTVDVLSQDGVYRQAEFKSFGRQRLMEVQFSDGRTILATPEHQWVVKNCAGKLVKLPTEKLIFGHHVPRTVAPRPEKNEEYREGVRHGFVFGDGSLYNHGKQAAAVFYGKKDEALMPFFEGCSEPKDYGDRRRIHGLPAAYKSLPDNAASASYWYGFVCGFLAADGSVDTYGCALLTQKPRATLEVIAEQLPRIGMVAGPVRGHYREATITQKNGTVNKYAGFMHYVTLLKQCMEPEDFLIEAHREKFEKNFKKTKYGQFIGIASVTDTGIEDEVFCCVEHETHTFVVDNGILSKNCYGNSFSSLFLPFDRFLRCRNDACRLERPIEKVKFEWTKNFEFKGKCPACGWEGILERIDRKAAKDRDMRVIRWSPHFILIQYNVITHDYEYRLRIRDSWKRAIQRGDEFYLRTTPWEFIQTIKEDKLFKFSEGALFHMKEQTLAGVRTVGWGIPRFISNFKQIYYIQVIKRYNEALALDYIVPFRVITPKPGSSKMADPLLHQDLSKNKSMVMDMVSNHRKDPATWNYLPFPIEYDALGGEGLQMAGHELINAATDDMLNAQGIPAELYRGTLQVQAAPMALRLFQQTWPHLVAAYNEWLNWSSDQIARTESWEPVDSNLQPVTLADDMEKKQIQIGRAHV